MNRAEQIEKVFINFKPFEIKLKENQAMMEKTINSYQEVRDKMKTATLCTVTCNPVDGEDLTVQFPMNDGVRQFIESSMLLQNLIYFHRSAHGADQVLTEESQKNTDLFFQQVFNLDPDDDSNEEFRFDEINEGDDPFYLSFYGGPDDDQCSISITFS